MSVVGFDLGTANAVVAIARRRGIDVLQNEVGKRLTPVIVSYGAESRTMGNAAQASQNSNAKYAITNIKRMLGKKASNPDMAVEKSYNYYQTGADDEGWTTVGVQFDGKEQFIRPEQVTAAMLTKLKQVAEDGLDGGRVVDCVLAVPSDWTDIERRAILTSAKLAGLNVLRLMNETTAVALNYGILRALPKDKPVKVLFYDMGYTSTQVSIASLIDGKLTVLAQATDRHLGGRDFDRLLETYFAAYIKDKYKMDVMTNTKARMKLATACEKCKLVLSANSVAPFNVEYIMNDTDVRGEITRDEFEKLASEDLLKRILVPVEKVMKSSGTKLEELLSMEVVGGGTRVPCVQSALQKWLGKDLSKTCDADESVARGCALMCAMLSPSFKVRPFDVHDVCSYPIQLQWGPVPAGWDKWNRPPEKEDCTMEHTALVFKENNQIPCVKLIRFQDRVEPFQVVARYEDVKQMPAGTEPMIARFVISGLPKRSPLTIKSDTKVRIKLDLHGVLQLSSAQMLDELKETEEEVAARVKAEQEAAKAKAEAAAAAKKGKKKGEKGEKAEAADKPAAADGAADAAAAGDNASGAADGAAPMDTSADKDDAAAGAAAAEAEKATDSAKPTDATETGAADAAMADDEGTTAAASAPKKKTQRTTLVVNSYTAGGMDEKTYNGLYESETTMAAKDKAVEDLERAKNELESYCLETRSSIRGGDLEEYVDEKTCEEFAAKLTELEDWIYDEGESAQKSEFVKRLAEARKTGDVIKARFDEAQRRPEAVTELTKSINFYEKFVSSADKKFEHIPNEKKDEVKKKVDEVNTWLVQTLGKQDRAPKYQEPLLTVLMLRDKQAELHAVCKPIVNTPKPKPAPKKEDTKDGDDKKDGAAAATAKDGDAAAAANASDAPAGGAEAKDGDAAAAAPAAEGDAASKAADAAAAAEAMD